MPNQIISIQKIGALIFYLMVLYIK